MSRSSLCFSSCEKRHPDPHLRSWNCRPSKTDETDRTGPLKKASQHCRRRRRLAPRFSCRFRQALLLLVLRLHTMDLRLLEAVMTTTDSEKGRQGRGAGGKD